MKLKYTIIFFAAIIVLLVSEYLFLTELNEAKRFLILLLTGIGVICSSLVAFLCYIRSSKDIA